MSARSAGYRPPRRPIVADPSEPEPLTDSTDCDGVSERGQRCYGERHLRGRFNPTNNALRRCGASLPDASFVRLRERDEITSAESTKKLIQELKLDAEVTH
jgi:hypothetical protein